MKAKLDLEGLKNPEKWEVKFSYFNLGNVYYTLSNKESDITLEFGVSAEKYPDQLFRAAGGIDTFKKYIQEAIEEDRIEVVELVVKREYGILI